MNANCVLFLAVGIGIVAGLRAMTAPAMVTWAAHLGWLNLHGSALAFMGSSVIVPIFTLAAIGEYVNDKLPKTSRRTATLSLIARGIMGGLSGASLCAAANRSVLVGALLGAMGAMIGTFAGYEARVRLVRALHVRDIFVAIPEDLVALTAAYFFVSAR